MVLQALLIMALWVIFIMLDLCLIRIIDGEKLSFESLVNKELVTLIIICVIAPVVFLILVLGVAAKAGICISNNISLKGEKDCSNCTHCIHNECMFFKLTIRPRMLCKGRFFSSN